MQQQEDNSQELSSRITRASANVMESAPIRCPLLNGESMQRACFMRHDTFALWKRWTDSSGILEKVCLYLLGHLVLCTLLPICHHLCRGWNVEKSDIESKSQGSSQDEIYEHFHGNPPSFYQWATFLNGFLHTGSKIQDTEKQYNSQLRLV